jgi:hypothetical protein
MEEKQKFFLLHVQSIDGRFARRRRRSPLLLQLLSFFLSFHRTVVSKQAEFEKAVFAKTARVNARGDGERAEEKEEFPFRTMFFDLFSTSDLSLSQLTTEKKPLSPLRSRDHAPRRRGCSL